MILTKTIMFTIINLTVSLLLIVLASQFALVSSESSNSSESKLAARQLAPNNTITNIQGAIVIPITHFKTTPSKIQKETIQTINATSTITTTPLKLSTAHLHQTSIDLDYDSMEPTVLESINDIVTESSPSEVIFGHGDNHGDEHQILGKILHNYSLNIIQAEGSPDQYENGNLDGHHYHQIVEWPKQVSKEINGDRFKGNKRSMAVLRNKPDFFRTSVRYPSKVVISKRFGNEGKDEIDEGQSFKVFSGNENGKSKKNALKDYQL